MTKPFDEWLSDMTKSLSQSEIDPWSRENFEPAKERKTEARKKWEEQKVIDAGGCLGYTNKDKDSVDGAQIALLGYNSEGVVFTSVNGTKFAVVNGKLVEMD